MGLQVETLEDRQLMAAGIFYNSLLGTVTIEGADSDDVAKVRIDDRAAAKLAGAGVPIARAEGFEWHARSMEARIGDN